MNNIEDNIIPFSENIPVTTYSQEEIKLILMGHFIDSKNISTSDDSILIKAEFDPENQTVAIYTKNNPSCKTYVQNS